MYKRNQYRSRSTASLAIKKHDEKTSLEAKEAEDTLNIKYTCRFIIAGQEAMFPSKTVLSYDEYLCTLENTDEASPGFGQVMPVKFRRGIGHREEYRDAYEQGYLRRQPSVLGVLYGIMRDATDLENFEWWCDSHGLDTDSRHALDVYLTCQAQTAEFFKKFPGVDLEEYEPLKDY